MALENTQDIVYFFGKNAIKILLITVGLFLVAVVIYFSNR